MEEVILRGLPISKGIGIGPPVFFSSMEENMSEAAILPREIEGEIFRYREALALSRRDVETLHHLSLNEGPSEVVAVLDTHLELMNDPLMTTDIEKKIRSQQQKTESIFYRLIEEYKQRFSILQDGYFQERIRDVVDVSKRILGHLKSFEKIKITEIAQHSIVFVYELTPSEIIEASSSLTFVTFSGGIASHAAIIARAKGNPYVTNIDMKTIRMIPFDLVIVDGSEGMIILNPTKQTLKKYQEIKNGYLQNYRRLKKTIPLKAETIDGYEIDIFANLETPKEVDLLLKNGGAGVGLFRSEYLFLSKAQFPTEEEQFEVYKKIAKPLQGLPLVVRIFDVGGDKKIDLALQGKDHWYFMDIGDEPNPALGCRAIRFLLRYPDILRTQIRAILRASILGDIRILIPMVSDISEVRKVKEIIHSIRSEFTEKGIPFSSSILIGCMIEIPSSALMCDVIAKEVDFLSIGTNDLIQYTLAIDRSNHLTSNLYFPIHPSILRLIQTIVTAANEAHKPLILCGESAADPLLIPLFMGLGIRKFSVAVRQIPLLKHTIRKWRITEAHRTAYQALQASSAEELHVSLASSCKN